MQRIGLIDRLPERALEAAAIEAAGKMDHLADGVGWTIRLQRLRQPDLQLRSTERNERTCHHGEEPSVGRTRERACIAVLIVIQAIAAAPA
ncbi:hypothetical protein ACQR0Z_34405 [Bradyrhizobium sp. HKCCYLS3077]|uniref:hypothetical protein n=1 Tax=Bradyrhizobium sp. HKCCYLS3077 TaxID=3420761 RepID=UPI003EBA3976